SIICEIKKASPSKGVIDPEFKYLQIGKEYERAGGDCISCLTEPYWFLGSDEIFKNVREEVSIPMLRKDFVVDEYQIYQAALMGANCILLIVELLDDDTLAKYLETAKKLGLCVLTETHDDVQVKRAVSLGAKVIGINNRNLKDFTVDVRNSLRLRELIPDDCICVAESGIKTVSDAVMMYEGGADAILVGEALMRSDNKRDFIKSVKELCL
ncbi:MAG: indole-3-glycerol phosphate synthase TrpC, partial [Lachnospiraceae bacterium]|nr:indole-3-glycerol phosphate synthase TrpC [Lachnospiraceae bacterium]